MMGVLKKKQLDLTLALTKQYDNKTKINQVKHTRWFIWGNILLKLIKSDQ